jgi:hypothetical protein
MGDTQNTPLTISHRQHWSAKLTHSLALKDGTELVMLADALTCLIRYFWTVTGSGSLGRDPDYAIELIKAADTGAYPDRDPMPAQRATRPEAPHRWRPSNGRR